MIRNRLACTILLGCTVLLSLAFNSCAKKDDMPKNKELTLDEVIGTYERMDEGQLVQIIITKANDNTIQIKNPVNNKTELFSIKSRSSDNIIFKLKDNTNLSYDLTITYTHNNRSLQYTLTQNDETHSFTFQKKL